jgi:hypothetical protein
LTWSRRSTDKTVTTDRKFAIIIATIGIKIIAIITNLAQIDHAVPAKFKSAIRTTAVVADRIAIITLLARSRGRSIYNPVATGFDCTVRAATVTKDLIRIVAFLAGQGV